MMSDFKFVIVRPFIVIWQLSINTSSLFLSILAFIISASYIYQLIKFMDK
jgi:hypothetical protein